MGKTLSGPIMLQCPLRTEQFGDVLRPTMQQAVGTTQRLSLKDNDPDALQGPQVMPAG